IDLSYYVMDNWKISVGHRYLGRRHALALGTEYMLPAGGDLALSAFAEARFGQRRAHVFWAGLRLYFGGGDKPLIRRDREDLAPNRLVDDVLALAILSPDIAHRKARTANATPCDPIVDPPRKKRRKWRHPHPWPDDEDPPD